MRGRRGLRHRFELDRGDGGQVGFCGYGLEQGRGLGKRFRLRGSLLGRLRGLRGLCRRLLLRRLLLRRRLLDDRLLDDGLAPQSLGVGKTAYAVGERVVDARRVTLHADLQALAQVEHDLVLDAKLPRQLVDPDLLRGQSRSRLLSFSRFRNAGL
jgi:hypothetical protein